MTWLLDTNVCIAYLNGRDSKLRQRFLAHSPDDLRLCSTVKGELLYGARHSNRVDSNLRRLDSLFSAFESLPFDDDAAHWYGLIRAQLKSVGQPIGANDFFIAATALAAGATLVTRNSDEFLRVPGLAVEIW